MDFIQAIIVGLVQGLTEFLPISSTAHVRIMPAMFGWDDPGSAFTAAIQMGTILAVLIYFRNDLVRILKEWIKSIKERTFLKHPEGRIGWAIMFGTLPISVLGLALKDSIETTFRSLHIIAWALIGLGLLMGVSELVAKKSKNLEKVSIWTGIWVGFWQALALIPGMSRSGSTITGALFAGFDRATAARFSFLLSVPAIIAAGLYNFKSHSDQLLHESLTPMLIANAAAFVSGYWAIAFLIKFLQKRSTLVFILYRVALGVIILGLLNQGILTP